MAGHQPASPDAPLSLKNAERIVESVRHPLLVLDERHRVVTANPAFYNAFRVEPDEILGRPLQDLGNRQWDIPELRGLLDDVIPERRAFDDFRVEHYFETIGQRIMLINGRRLDHTGNVLLAIEDVTEKERASDLRAAELNHRLKNAMQTVQALMAITMKQSRSLEEFRVSFDGRLRALAKVQELLTEGEHTGVKLREMFEGEFKPYCGPEGPVHECSTEGDEVLLTAEAASSLQMVLHELTTNAVKHGALSTQPDAERGRIHVQWRVVGPEDPIPKAAEPGPSPSRGGKAPRLELVWTETGGPFGRRPEGKRGVQARAAETGATASTPVRGRRPTEAPEEVPDRSAAGEPSEHARPPGFGLSLIRSIIDYELEGEFESELSDEGFRCRIVLFWTDRIRFRPGRLRTTGHVVSEDVKYDRAGQPLPHDHPEQEWVDDV